MTANPSTQGAVLDIVVAQIVVPAGRRRLDPAWVETLADMMSGPEDCSPIEVIERDGALHLVFGAHRVAAARRNGWPTIPGRVRRPADFAHEAEITLREIIENMGRRELSVLDRAVDIARWREVYEAVHGAVKPGRRKLSQVATIADDPAERFSASFSDVARQTLGLTRDGVSRAMRIAAIRADVRDRMALHPIADNQSDLLQLAAEPAARQADIAALLTAEPPQASNVASAIAILDRTPAPAPEPRWQKVSTAFSQLKDTEQARFYELHQAGFLLWLKGRPS